MSASPAQVSSGPNSVTPSAGSVGMPVIRKRPTPNIFNQRKKPVKRALTAAGPKSSTPASTQNSNTSAPHQNPVTKNHDSHDPAAYTDYPIIISKRALDQGLHYHAFKIQSRPDASGKPAVINPFDANQFTRPVHLHRRSGNDRLEVPEQSDAASGVDDKEREILNARRAERQAEKEANQALIAPTGEPSAKQVKRKKPQKKIEDQIWDDQDPKNQERKRLRYEEARPWHLEDFDGKNKWVGTYEAPLSKTSVMFAVTEAGFRMVPVEKWYKMAPVSRVEKRLDADQIEKQMQQKYSMPRWWMGTQTDNLEARKQAYMIKREGQQQIKRKQDSDDDEGGPTIKEDYQADVDEIDFEFNDEFQDDDEGFVFGENQDDEAKDIEKRIREEMRSANLPGTGFRDEDRDYDAEEQREKEAETAERKRQRKLRKQLQKKERRNEYESDSDDLFTSSSGESDSEEEKERSEEDQKKEEVQKASQTNGDKSGTSTKGTNTPTGRVEKRSHPSLKRDADLSELSGNESSRKKAKGVNGRAVSPTSLNGLRALSPDAAKRKPSGYGSGSDTDTSRAGRSKTTLKLKHSPPGSPADSRSGTPLGSRAQSPKRPASTGPAPSPQLFPTLEEVRAAIPKDGIGISDLVKSFKLRVANNSGNFIALVKQAGKQDPVTKKIMPKS